jgi:hypothetical protein
MKFFKQLFLLAAFPLFAVIETDSEATDGECECVFECDIDAGICEATEDSECECYYECNPGVDCEYICFCDGDEEADEVLEGDDLVYYGDLADDEGQIAYTGMMGTSEGTYADSEEVYILDGDTEFTNENDIAPAWCE